MLAQTRGPQTRKSAKALFVLRAMIAARPGHEKRAAKRALKKFRRRFPKGSTGWSLA